ncbi:hypothetical protein PybrP1_004238 [[Pythium] brassicae (nom. inval.)]|nr:hypothetical protein PybrP1_004238 [[Pythium] brassicae (nom. inval.)]
MSSFGAKAALLRGLRAGASRSSASLRSRSFVSASVLKRALVGRTANVPVLERSSAARAWAALGSASLSSAAAAGSDGERVAVGDRVVLQVNGSLSNGEKFGQTERPLTFLVGSGDVLPGIEEAVVGLRKGERKSVEIAPAKAFGAEKQIHTVPRAQLNFSAEDEAQLAIGVGLQLQNGQQAHIVKVTAESIDIDLAHPYAGETLFAELEVVDHVARAQLGPDERLVLPEELSPGDNASFPARGDTLVMHYVGSLAADGSVFDSSRDRGQPFEFQIGVGQVIKGWDEGVMRMSKGQKALLRIPAAKGYGRAGAGAAIPPDADLVFEVELLDIIR